MLDPEAAEVPNGGMEARVAKTEGESPGAGTIAGVEAGQTEPVSKQRAPITKASGLELAGHVHLLGAGGAGVSGLGRILLARGVEVSGHDRADSQLLEALDGLELAIELGESKAEDLPAHANMVIHSAAVPQSDPQIQEAHRRGLPVLKYAQALPFLAAPERLMAVAGTHGKTTASWMLWYALEGIAEVCSEPVAGALIGGICRRLKTNALAGSEDAWFCVEACEYDRTFLNLSPKGAIITNVDEDHLDCYGSMDALHRAFACFVEQVPSDGLVVLGREVPESVELGGRAACIWRMGNEIEVDLLGEERGAFRFRLRGPGWATPPIQLQVPGHFNVENAGLALALAIGLSERFSDVDVKLLAAGAARGLERFGGVHRRFENWGSSSGVDVVHDYAHHPTEVRVTLEAAQRAFPRHPIHILFQPHQYTRTARFLHEFAESLRGAAHVVVSDVYGARTFEAGEKIAGAADLVQQLKVLGVDAAEGGDLLNSVGVFTEALPEQATALILGAGDIELIQNDLLRRLALRSPL
jgi:UDP-N-acetylmuramate--alanine ligase